MGEGKVSIPEARVETIRNFKHPRTKSELKYFFRRVSYYRKFIRDFSRIAHPLTEATKKCAPKVLYWSSDMVQAFHVLCNCLANFFCYNSPTCYGQVRVIY